MLEREYKGKKFEIKSRLLDFKKNRRIFEELCFCLCTPQSKARACDRAIRTLQKGGLLSKGNRNQISKVLKDNGVRFHNNKASYIVEAREVFPTTRRQLKTSSNNKEVRGWLVKNVKGLGYKEASHFLRNIGRGEGLAILDRHIIKNLCDLRVVCNVPESLSEKRYLEIEQKMLEFSKKIKIPMEELDLLLWSMETGEVFK